MNTEHKVTHNDLANWIIAQYEDWIRPNGNLLSVAAIVIAIIIVSLVYTSRASERHKAAAWRMYFNALQSNEAEKDLESIAIAYKGQAVGEQARLSLGRFLLSESISKIFEDKQVAVTKAENSLAQFQALQELGTDETLKAEAGFMLGQAYETLASARTGKNDLEEAVKTYAAVAEKYPNEFWGKQAKEQSEMLNKASTKYFLKSAAVKVLEKPKASDFKVDSNLGNETFSNGPADFDASKILEGLTNKPEGETALPVKPEEPKPADKPAETEKK